MADQQNDPQLLLSPTPSESRADVLVKVTPKVEKRKKPTFEKPNEFVIFIANKDGENATFTVHKEFACHYSPVLDAAFNSDFIEGQSQTYIFSDHSAKTLQLFVAWIYNLEVSLSETDIENGEDGARFF